VTDVTLRRSIQQALAACGSGPLAASARALLALLGYRSDRYVDAGPSADEFLATFDADGRLNRDNARVGQWRSVEMVFQITGEELERGGQTRMIFEAPAFDAQTYRSFLFFAVELDAKPNGRLYTRGELATITREVNKLFTMPVSVVFRHAAGDETLLTLAIVTHRPNLRDGSRDVLEKVSLIRDVRASDPHRAHIEILADLALPALITRQAIAGFNDLQRAWARTLDITELNRRFYREIANWYFWAVQQVEFPDDGTPRARRNADRVIRLITRLIFVWFLREKGLVDPALFRRAEVERLLVTLDDDASSYYQAILQNLFFGTLNQEMGKRAFRRSGQNYGAFNLYRYEALFRDPQAALALFERIPFLNGGLFECLDDFNQKPPIRIDAFSDRPDSQPTVPNALFFTAQPLQVDLNATYGTRGRRYAVRGILEILESYKFTVAENTPVEEDVALDPELLGQVFENLLAAYNPETETTARKETGSFYTPRNVVAYMVDESLLLYLRDHLRKAAPLIPPPPAFASSKDPSPAAPTPTPLSPAFASSKDRSPAVPTPTPPPHGG
jgi:adenine-specific DNA-methyltransferase